MNDLLRIAQVAEERATDLARASVDHGPRHWRDVARIGLALRDGTGVNHDDYVMLFCFAALHDTQRESEHRDPDHGRRAAEVAEAMYEEGLITLRAEHLRCLFEALIRHDDGTTGHGAIIGPCLDADRLTISRVGIVPEVSYFTTKTVHDSFSDWVRWADNVRNAPDPGWEKIVNAYYTAMKP